MKQLILTAIAAIIATAASAQFKRLIVEEVDNGGAVPGRTFRIYAELSHPEDHLHAVYGDAEVPMVISSTKPFYQHEDGGALSKDVLRKRAQENPALKYDSWFTIGLEDNYVNQLQTFGLDFTAFEEGKSLNTSDGIWFATPDGSQVYARNKNRVLIMQLTTEGTVTGTINLQGRTVGHYLDGRIFESTDATAKERQRIGAEIRRVNGEKAALVSEIEALRDDRSQGALDKKADLTKRLKALDIQLDKLRDAEKKSAGDVWKSTGITFTCG